MLDVDQGAKTLAKALTAEQQCPNKSEFKAFWLLTAVVMAHLSEIKPVFAPVSTLTGFSLCQIDCMGSLYPML